MMLEIAVPADVGRTATVGRRYLYKRLNYIRFLSYFVVSLNAASVLLTMACHAHQPPRREIPSLMSETYFQGHNRPRSETLGISSGDHIHETESVSVTALHWLTITEILPEVPPSVRWASNLNVCWCGGFS